MKHTKYVNIIDTLQNQINQTAHNNPTALD